ncbi:MAG: ECF RNA polymerase sigma-E factor [Flavobacteriaceae bacterium]|nr:MAG: ECF RNA polymerase sigma-E factor [Flavobacteriaceae bacterium]
MNQKEFLDMVLPIKDNLYRLARRFLISSDEAQDAVQEVFLKLWKNKEAIKKYRSPEAFAYTMTKNYCLDRLKSKQASNLKLVHTNFENRTDLEQHIEAKDGVSLLFKLMETLPEQQKTILHLRDVEQLEFAEIAKITNTSQANVRVALSRARKKIKDLLLKQYNHGVQ